MLTRDIKIEGIALKLARTPIVHLADVERHLLAKTLWSEGRTALVTAIYHGIRRTRKECEASGAITLEWLIESVDIENGPELMQAFMDLNFPRKGGAAPGEAVAGEQAAAPPP